MDILQQALIAWTIGLFLWTGGLIWATATLWKEQGDLTQKQLGHAWWIARSERERRQRL